MKKRLKGKTTNCHSVALYETDLAEIMELITSVSASLKISDEEFEYSNFEEVKTKRGPIVKKLTIESDSPTIWLKIGEGKTELHHDGNLRTITPYAQIKAILNSSQRPVLHALLNTYVAIGSVIVIVILGLIYPPPWPALVAIPLIPLMFAIVIASAINHSGGFSRIVFMARHDQQSFLVRNRDTIIIMLVTNILTALLTLLVSYILFKQGIK